MTVPPFCRKDQAAIVGHPHPATAMSRIDSFLAI